MKVLVISDTHVRRPGGWMPKELQPHLEDADRIIHAGDLMENFLLDELEACAPTIAVQGNMDPLDSPLPETREFELEGVKFAVIHDSGEKKGRARRMRRRFPEARVVIFGHSHIPVLEDDGEQMLLNPGSPTDKRRQPDFSFSVMEIDDGEVSAEIFRF